MAACGSRTEVYSRVCGYHRPVKYWNRGKREEFADRVPYAEVDHGWRRPRQDMVEWADPGAAAAD